MLFRALDPLPVCDHLVLVPMIKWIKCCNHLPFTHGKQYLVCSREHSEGTLYLMRKKTWKTMISSCFPVDLHFNQSSEKNNTIIKPSLKAKNYYWPFLNVQVSISKSSLATIAPAPIAAMASWERKPPRPLRLDSFSGCPRHFLTFHNVPDSVWLCMATFLKTNWLCLNIG